MGDKFMMWRKRVLDCGYAPDRERKVALAEGIAAKMVAMHGQLTAVTKERDRGLKDIYVLIVKRDDQRGMMQEAADLISELRGFHDVHCYEDITPTYGDKCDDIIKRLEASDE